LYPDAMIVCGEPKIHSRGTDAVLNPTVIFEVLSPWTEAYDRGKKFELSAKAESLKEYVLVSQDEPRVESFARRENGTWLRRLFAGLDALLVLESVELEIPLSEVYDRLEFPSEASQVT
jgi:Uma2 family endonuclease